MIWLVIFYTLMISHFLLNYIFFEKKILDNQGSRHPLSDCVIYKLCKNRMHFNLPFCLTFCANKSEPYMSGLGYMNQLNHC